jgi:hypothetical protein
MAQTNGLYKNVVLTDNASQNTIALTITSPGGADTIAVAVDTGNSSSATVGVQSLLAYCQNFRLRVDFNTPNLDGATVALTA